MAIIGYKAQAGPDGGRAYQHTNDRHSFYHDSKWWSLIKTDSSGRWGIYEFGTLPASPGDLGGWTDNSAQLSQERTASGATCYLDQANGVLWTYGDNYTRSFVEKFTYSVPHGFRSFRNQSTPPNGLEASAMTSWRP